MSWQGTGLDDGDATLGTGPAGSMNSSAKIASWPAPPRRRTIASVPSTGSSSCPRLNQL